MSLTENVKNKIPRPDLAALQESAKDHVQRIQPYLPAVFFAGGFVFDLFTLGRIDNIFNIISHGIYLALTLLVVILQINEVQPAEDAGALTRFFFKYKNEAAHFMLGALLNAFVIFYFKSGSFVNTFLLVILLFVLLVINEIDYFKKRGPAMKMVLFTISLSSFFIYLVPILFGKTGGGIFLISQACALIVILVVWWILLQYQVDLHRIRRNFLIPGCAVIFAFILLYAGRIIPPVPLSLKQIGIYHNIEPAAGKYKLYRLTPDWKFWARGDQHFKARSGDRIYLFTRIFAPGGFRDRLYLHFQVKNKKGEWVGTDRIPMRIVGGRNEGFRAYAYKQNYIEGEWRAMVKTAEDLEIGRINFEVEKTESSEERIFYTETY